MASSNHRTGRRSLRGVGRCASDQDAQVADGAADGLVVREPHARYPVAESDALTEGSWTHGLSAVSERPLAPRALRSGLSPAESLTSQRRLLHFIKCPVNCIIDVVGDEVSPRVVETIPGRIDQHGFSADRKTRLYI